MLYVQTFGDLVTFIPHIHAFVADGVFYPSGSFRVLPPLPEEVLTGGLRHRVLEYLCEKAGFDPEGRKQLARFHVRNPFALKKMTYDKQTGMGHTLILRTHPKRSGVPRVKRTLPSYD